jgi:spermidine synthase
MRRTPVRMVLVALLLAGGSAASAPRVLYEKQSPYSFIRVTEDGEGRRSLRFDRSGALQSQVRPGEPLRLEIGYTQVAMAGLTFVPAPKRLLVVGMGGGAMPMFLRAVLPNAYIDTVDIDPDVVDVAKRFFGFQEDARMHAHVADGRRFIEEKRPAYDIIFLDAFGPLSIPEHMGTREFLLAVRARLAPGGVVVSNVWQEPNPLYPSMVRTYKDAFPRLLTFDVPQGSNRILVGLTRPRAPSLAVLEARAERLERQRHVPFDLSALVRFGYEDPAGWPAIGEVLRDRPTHAWQDPGAGLLPRKGASPAAPL